MPIGVTPKYKLLVAHGRDSVDYGSSVPQPTRTRSQFTYQTVTLPTGNGRVNGPVQTIPPPTAGAKTAAIRVLANTYWDPTVAAPPPFYATEEIQVFDLYLTAGEDFGLGLGSGGGTPTQIATNLALALNSIPGVRASSSTDTVYITSFRFDATLPLAVSNDTEALLSGYMFQLLGPAGEVLTSPTSSRAIRYMMKAVKSQSPPEILP